MATSQGTLGDILTHYEAEQYIEHLEIFDIKEYGSDKWFKQDEILQRINMQAHVNAMINSEEFIMETCCTFDKVKALIYDLVCSEIWKQQVLPLIKKEIIQLNSYRSYITIYHEAVTLNLLEIIMFHRTAVEGADEYLYELIEYGYRKLMYLTKFPQTKQVEKKSMDEILKKTQDQEYEDQIKDIQFNISMMCLSIIRYITDYVKYLPIGIHHHLLVECDVLCLLVPLIEDKPWLRINTKGDREKFENSKWQVVDKNEYNRLPKLEAQVWISIYNLFMDPECRKKYELNEYRKSNLLRLRKYMNEILLDQLPNFTAMLRSLEELAIMNVNQQSVSNPFVIQQMPELRTAIMKNKNWREIAEYQKTNFFTQNLSQQKEDMKRLADLYGNNIIEGLMDGFKCATCQKDAAKRCSKCKSVWYCTRDCQLADWKEHKKECNILQQKQQLATQSKEEIKKVQIEEIQSNENKKNNEQQNQNKIQEQPEQNNKNNTIQTQNDNKPETKEEDLNTLD